MHSAAARDWQSVWKGVIRGRSVKLLTCATKNPVAFTTGSDDRYGLRPLEGGPCLYSITNMIPTQNRNSRGSGGSCFVETANEAVDEADAELGQRDGDGDREDR